MLATNRDLYKAFQHCSSVVLTNYGKKTEECKRDWVCCGPLFRPSSLIGWQITTQNSSNFTRTFSAFILSVGTVQGKPKDTRVELTERMQAFDFARREIDEIKERERQLQQEASGLQTTRADTHANSHTGICRRFM
jgi:hypothetical protein